MAARQRRGPRWALIVLSGIVSALLSPGACAEIKHPEGGEVTLKANYTGDPSEINWKKNGDKVVDMELRPLLTHFYRLDDRATISPTNGSLTIRNLTVGDSGHYMAEALVNNTIHETHYDLTVIACPAEPTISDNSTEDQIELICKCKTPGVTYEWWKQTRLVAQNALYTSPRPRQDVTLTCVVYVEKDACKNETSITIRFIPDNRLPPWAIAVIVFLVVVASISIVISIYCCKRCSKMKANSYRGRPEKSCFDNFLPLRLRKASQVTCKNNGQQLNEDGRIQLHPDEDLPINNATSADKGKNTAHCYNQAPQEEIHLTF